jgi:hypothetical protein
MIEAIGVPTGASGRTIETCDCRTLNSGRPWAGHDTAAHQPRGPAGTAQTVRAPGVVTYHAQSEDRVIEPSPPSTNAHESHSCKNRSSPTLSCNIRGMRETEGARCARWRLAPWVWRRGGRRRPPGTHHGVASAMTSHIELIHIPRHQTWSLMIVPSDTPFASPHVPPSAARPR